MLWCGEATNVIIIHHISSHKMTKNKILLKDIEETIDALLLAEKYIPKGVVESSFEVVANIAVTNADFSVEDCYKKLKECPENYKIKEEYSINKVDEGYKIVESMGLHKLEPAALSFDIAVSYMGMG